MTNFKKNQDEILKMAQSDQDFAVIKESQALANCSSTDCFDYLFTHDCSQPVKFRWLCDEIVEPAPAPTLTVKERGFCEIVEHGYIARDKDGSLYFYLIRPFKDDEDDYEWNNAYA